MNFDIITATIKNQGRMATSSLYDLDSANGMMYLSVYLSSKLVKSSKKLGEFIALH